MVAFSMTGLSSLLYVSPFPADVINVTSMLTITATITAVALLCYAPFSHTVLMMLVAACGNDDAVL